MDIFRKAYLESKAPEGKLTLWDVGFVNRLGEGDETQLDAHSAMELRELWNEMHDEFEADFDSILYIEEGREW